MTYDEYKRLERSFSVSMKECNKMDEAFRVQKERTSAAFAAGMAAAYAQALSRLHYVAEGTTEPPKVNGITLKGSCDDEQMTVLVGVVIDNKIHDIEVISESATNIDHWISWNSVLEQIKKIEGQKRLRQSIQEARIVCGSCGKIRIDGDEDTLSCDECYGQYFYEK